MSYCVLQNQFVYTVFLKKSRGKKHNYPFWSKEIEDRNDKCMTLVVQEVWIFIFFLL